MMIEARMAETRIPMGVLPVKQGATPDEVKASLGEAVRAMLEKAREHNAKLKLPAEEPEPPRGG